MADDKEKEISEEHKKKLHKEAMLAFALKLRYEKILKNKVGKLFDVIVKDFRAHYAKHGASINAFDYQKDLEEVLREHHIKVGNAFSNSIRNELGEPGNNKNVQKKLEASIKGKAAQRAHLTSHDITDTTRENLEKAVKKAHVDFALEDEEITHEGIAELAGDYLDTSLTGREEVIAITETGIAASMGKTEEYDTLNNMESSWIDEESGEEITLKDMDVKKMWVAILDDHTREWHVEADGQIVGIDEPFDVGGEELPEPLDDSLGASAENICNCRCVSVNIYEP